jgi:hypothetical protein
MTPNDPRNRNADQTLRKFSCYRDCEQLIRRAGFRKSEIRMSQLSGYRLPL